MGVVYEADDLMLDRRIALKFLPQSVSKDPVARRRLMVEAKSASRLDHQNICTIYGVEETDEGLVYIVMACYTGKTLRETLLEATVSLECALELGIQIAAGLAHAHEEGITHRDIKPGNLMITDRGVLKILDFGLARTSDATTTTAGMMKGTVGYMSPEQVRGEAAGPPSDVWSLGVVLYEMLSGFRPFVAAYDSAVFYAILNIDPVPPRQHNPGIPKWLEDVVLKALAKDPSDRYQSAAELEADLRNSTVSASQTTGAEADPPPSRPPRPVRRRILIVASLAILLISIRPLWNLIFAPPHPLPALLSLGILPTLDETIDSSRAALTRGITHAISYEAIGMVDRRPALWVVPYREARYYGTATTEEVAREFHVSHVLRPEVTLTGDEATVDLQLVDAPSQQIVRTESFTAYLTDRLGFVDRVQISLTRLLEARSNSERRLGGAVQQPASSEAFRLFLEAQGSLYEYSDSSSLTRATTLLHASWALDSSSADVARSLASALIRRYYETGNPTILEETVRYADASVRIAPGSATTHYVRGAVSQIAGDPTSAEESYRRSLRLNPQYRPAVASLGTLLANQDRPVDAESLYIRAIRANDWNYEFHERLARLYFDETRYEDAVLEYGRVIELAPQNLRGYIGQATGYLRLGDIERAEFLFLKADSMESEEGANKALILYNLGELRYRVDDFYAAAGYYERSLRLDSMNYSAWSDLGNAYHWLNRVEDAKENWSRLIDLAESELSVNPRSAGALEFSALSHAKLGHEEEALASIQLLVTIPGVTPEQKVSIGKAFEIMNMRNEAFVYIDQAIDEGFDLQTLNASRWLDHLRQDRRFLCRTEGDPCA